MIIKERNNLLRKIMQKKGIDLVLIPTADYHMSEYVADYFKCRQFMSGFDGSAGTLIITSKEAGLWTDGRYFIQAENQLKGSGITLFRMNEEGVPTVLEYIEEMLPENGKIAFDGRVVTAVLGRMIKRIAEKKNAKLLVKEDLINLIWKERPAFPYSAAFDLPLKFAGISSHEKIEAVQNQLCRNGLDALVEGSLENIAWLLNMRGHDIQYTPVALSFLIIEQKKITLYIDKRKLSEELKKRFKKEGIECREYEEIYKDVQKFNKEDQILLDPSRLNYRLFSSIKKSVKTVEQPSLISLMKAVKNPIEIENLRKAHIKDGVAVTRFMIWLKKNLAARKITEWDVDQIITKFREEQEGFIEKSFETIAGYKANAAMMHYIAEKGNCDVLDREGMLLVDSGGHYYEGTTDITRTFACGKVSDKMKHDFTLVLKSMLQLSRARFLYGCTGLNLDILARGPLWNEGIDYKCGTGHGVGYLLSVHEGPQSIRWRSAAGYRDSEILREGMVITNEPGIYLEKEYGIRIENQMVCRRMEKNEYGQFMGFETLTLVPIDLDLIDASLLEKRDIIQLNQYHEEVYKKISPYLNEEEKDWLKAATKAVS